MTDDKTQPAKPLHERFEIALEELVGMCHDGGLHSSDMIPALRYWLNWLNWLKWRAEDATKTSDAQR